MKYILKLLVIVFITFGCNNEPKQDGIAANDTTIVSKKIVPPLGTQNVRSEEGLILGKSMARALALATIPDSTKVSPSGDTILYFSELKVYAPAPAAA